MIMTVTAAISTPPLLHVDKMKPLLESHGSSGIGLRVCFLGFVFIAVVLGSSKGLGSFSAKD